VVRKGIRMALEASRRRTLDGHNSPVAEELPADVSFDIPDGRNFSWEILQTALAASSHISSFWAGNYNWASLLVVK